MSDFRRIDDQLIASPQITADDIAAAKAMGVTTIINNRPEGEAQDQTPGAEIEAAARKAGMAYIAIPVTNAGLSDVQVDAMVVALENAEGRVLAYCRSGTRSTMLWSLAAARRGEDPETIAARAAAAGYDVTPVRALIDMMSTGSR